MDTIDHRNKIIIQSNNVFNSIAYDLFYFFFFFAFFSCRFCCFAILLVQFSLVQCRVARVIMLVSFNVLV